MSESSIEQQCSRKLLSTSCTEGYNFVKGYTEY